jgi:hypothetical protein
MAGVDNSFLEAALIGLEAQKRDIETAMAEIQRRLGKISIPGLGPLMTAPTRKKRRISPEGRARIAEAQRKRWAKVKKGN